MARGVKVRQMLLKIILVLFCCAALMALWQLYKPLPAGLSLAGPVRQVSEDRVRFLSDLTTVDDSGVKIVDQQIFPTLFELIDQAQRYILIDMFLFNDHQGAAGLPAGPLAAELADHLIARKQAIPELQIDIISDPINNAYNGAEAKALKRLQDAGVHLVLTDPDRLRDSNPFYSAWWRLLLRWIPDAGHFLPHPFDSSGDKVGLASWLRLLNFKANHRKTAVVDQDGSLVALVASANPHGASKLHSNVALLVSDFRLARDLYLSEAAVARFSGGRLSHLPEFAPTKQAPERSLTLQLLTEEKIRQAYCRAIISCGAQDRVRLAMFYLSDRRIVAALLQAAEQGAQVELILDPNRDAFGYRKNGVPNRPLAEELREKSNGKIQIRWYRTHGEQFHSKLLLVEKHSGPSSIILGSANLTRRNLADFNLETDLLVTGPVSSLLFVTVSDYFDRLWRNRPYPYTVDYEEMSDASGLKYWQYRVQEWTGLGTF